MAFVKPMFLPLEVWSTYGQTSSQSPQQPYRRTMISAVAARGKNKARSSTGSPPKKASARSKKKQVKVPNKEDILESLKKLESPFMGAGDLILTNASLISLIRSVETKDLRLQGPITKDYHWSQEQASQLILSILGRRYIGPIVVQKVLEKGPDGKTRREAEVVIDGFQRLYSIISFFKGKDSQEKYPDGIPHLAGLKGEGEALTGLEFDAMSNWFKQAFEDHRVFVLRIPAETDRKVVWDIYRCINSGKVSPQQRRDSLMRGPYLDLVEQLVETDEFKRVIGRFQSKSKQEYRQLILRALSSRNYKKRSDFSQLQDFLDSELQQVQNKPEAEQRVWAEKKKKEFLHVMNLVTSIFPQKAVFHKWARKPSGTWGWSSQRSMPVWDMVYNATAALLDKGLLKPDQAEPSVKVLTKTLKDMYEDEENKQILSSGRKADIEKRFQLVLELLEKAL